MDELIQQLIDELNIMYQRYHEAKTTQVDYDFYHVVQPYSKRIDRELNELKTKKQHIVQLPYMNPMKFDLLISHIEELSIECHFQRTSRKLFMEKFKSVQYDLNYILNHFNNEG